MNIKCLNDYKEDCKKKGETGTIEGLKKFYRENKNK